MTVSFTELSEQFNELGWCRFPADTPILSWVDSIRREAESCLSDPALAHWWRYQHTWFVGVNCLANDDRGRVNKGPGLAGAAVNFIEQTLGSTLQLDQGQISAIMPGYPRADPDQTEASFRYRLKREAAHVDGLLLEDGERYAREYHAYILAIGLHDVESGASPFVVWNGSHKLIHRSLRSELDAYPEHQWPSIPIGDVYKQARRSAFDECQRVELSLNAGEAVLVHRLMLHGTAAWQSDQRGARVLCFFRPQTLLPQAWLSL